MYRHLSLGTLTRNGVELSQEFGKWIETQVFHLDRGSYLLSDKYELLEHASTLISDFQDQTANYLPWDRPPFLLGLRIAQAGSPVPLTEASKLFGVIVPVTDHCTVSTLEAKDDSSGIELSQGQYLLFLEQIFVHSIVDCLVLYFRKPETNLTGRT